MKTLIILMLLSVVRPPVMDPNTLDFLVDPNEIRYDLLEGFTVGFSDSRTIAMNVLIAGSPTTYSFRIYTAVDTIVDVNAVVVGLTSTLTRPGIVVDPNTNEAVGSYALTMTPTQKQVYCIHITATAVVQPTIFPAIGPITKVPYWLPQGVERLNASNRNDKQKIFQDYLAVASKYGAFIDKDVNRKFYLAWKRKLITIPEGLY